MIIFLLVLLVKGLAPIFVGLIILVLSWCRIVDIYENKATLMECFILVRFEYLSKIPELKKMNKEKIYLGWFPPPNIPLIVSPICSRGPF